MEFEVRAMAGMESCYASLPLSLIQTLDSSARASLPQILTLQLRPCSAADRRVWHLAWSGSSSSSSAIEVAQQFAECIGLPDRTIVQVRALPNVPKASIVTIEPLTEDDWEVIELNAENAEAAILQQVRIVHEKMRFPLWLHGGNAVAFIVVSTVPNNSVVQLVPGTEVAVAPKRRRKSVEHNKDPSMQSLDEIHYFQKVLLRVEDPKKRLTHKRHLGSADVCIELTSIALIHPETAKRFSFDSLQVVVLVPKLSSKVKSEKGNDSLMKGFSSPKKLRDDMLPGEKDSCYAIVHLLFSESVANGHLMLSQSLRQHLGASQHSWVYMQRYVHDPKKNISSFSLSPCQFLTTVNKDTQSAGLKVLNHGFTPKSMQNRMGPLDWSANDEFVSALYLGSSHKMEKEAAIPPKTNERVKTILHAWVMAQVHAISSMAGVEATSLVFGPKTFLHFEMVANDTRCNGKQQDSTTDNSQDARMVAGTINEMSFILTACGDSLCGGTVSAYQLAFQTGNEGINNSDGLRQLLEKLSLGDSISFDATDNGVFNHRFASTLSSLSWMGEAASDVFNRLTLLLSPASGMWFSDMGLPLPGHVLIYGPPGCGKTLLASTTAKALEEHENLLAHIVCVSCSALSLEKTTNIQQMLCDFVSDALDHAPSLLIFDDLDSIISSSTDAEGSPASASTVALTEFITGIMDDYADTCGRSCGLGPIAFLACVRNLDSIPHSLRASGRFDFHIQLPAPAATERRAILKHEIQKRSLQCPDDVLLDVASKCDGYDAYDLAILVDRSVHAAVSRFLPSHASFGGGNPTLTGDDFSQAMHDFLPVSMRDITKSASDGDRVGWEDVGGLNDVRNAIKEMIELPSKFPDIFAKSPLRLRSNVLLYGPPGCGKTHMVGAAAAASSLRFISVKGPELLNKYIGASEQAVRDVFSKAAAAAPCLLFFDEFDSIAPKRGHDNTGVTDRVVNQFLTELDGVEVLTGVFVFAATSRPDLLDAALLRPGRLDRLLFCDFPSLHDRLDILRVLSRKLPLAYDVDLESIAQITEGFSGADLQALLSDAQLAAVQELLDSGHDGKTEKKPTITDRLLKSVASKARPSVSESEKQRLYSIYSQFLDTKRSVAAQSRDAKGKRATLA